MSTELAAVTQAGRDLFARWENGDATEAEVAGGLWAFIDVLSTPPADDVREALDHLDALNESGRIQYADYVALHDMVLRIEVRPRGTVTEPSDEDVERMRAALNAADIDYSAREQRADAGGGDMEPGDWFTFLARAALRAGAETAPGTVTDAEVEAALAAMDRDPECYFGHTAAGVRVALEAAREARS